KAKIYSLSNIQRDNLLSATNKASPTGPLLPYVKYVVHASVRCPVDLLHRFPRLQFPREYGLMLRRTGLIQVLIQIPLVLPSMFQQRGTKRLGHGIYSPSNA